MDVYDAKLERSRYSGWGSGEPVSAVVATVARVLLAEPDPGLRRLLGDGLRDEGLDVLTVADGEALHLQLLLEGIGWGMLPDVLAIEVDLPIRDGLTVIDGLRSRGWNVPVVFMSSRVDPDLVGAAGRLGNCAVVRKPFAFEALRQEVWQALMR